MHLGEALSAYADGELSAAEQEQVEAHLDSCAPCRQELEALQSQRQAIRGAYANLELPLLEERVLAALRAEGIPHRSRNGVGAWLSVVIICLLAMLTALWFAAVPIKLARLLSRVVFGVAHAVAGTIVSELGWAWGLAVTALLLIGISGLSLRQLLRTVRT